MIQELIATHVAQLPEQVQQEFLERYEMLPQQDKDLVHKELLSMHPEFQEKSSEPQLRFGGMLPKRGERARKNRMYQNGGTSDPYEGYHGKEGKKRLQQQLKDAGYDVGSIDGILGKKTGAAIKAFQKDRGLAIDGIAGKNTLAALRQPKLDKNTFLNQDSVTALTSKEYKNLSRSEQNEVQNMLAQRDADASRLSPEQIAGREAMRSFVPPTRYQLPSIPDPYGGVNINAPIPQRRVTPEAVVNPNTINYSNQYPAYSTDYLNQLLNPKFNQIPGNQVARENTDIRLLDQFDVKDIQKYLDNYNK